MSLFAIQYNKNFVNIAIKYSDFPHNNSSSGIKTKIP